MMIVIAVIALAVLGIILLALSNPSQNLGWIIGIGGAIAIGAMILMPFLKRFD
jgi:hypothetical protein